MSVVVALHRLTPRAVRCLETAVALCGEHHEVLAVSDERVAGLPAGVRSVVTGAETDTSPAEKRDTALTEVRGDICAFIDDDAYPSPDWIERALARLEDPGVAAVGGPGVTPPGSPLRERLAGAFYESPFGSGGLRYRFTPAGSARDVDDYPAYNFFARTEALRAVGGWASRFYGGEDTKLCLTLVSAGYRIVYDPAVVVFHFRRPVFRAHMRQVGNVGRHRGWFVRAFPETTRRPLYFAPSALLIGAPFVAGWATRRRSRARALAAISLAGWAMVAGVALRDGQGARVAVPLPLVLAAGHGAYGWGFLRGLFSRKGEWL